MSELFNRMSGSYERVNYLTSFGFSLRWRQQLMKKIQQHDEVHEVIDLMTGMGETWSSIVHRFPNTNLTALDFSSGMLSHAASRNEKYYQQKVKLIQADLLAATLPSNHYDVVICAFGMKTFNQDQLSKLAHEVKRILKPGGQFSFIEISKPDNLILRSLYQFYLKHLIPILGKLLLGDPAEYRMLWFYTNQFVNAKTTCELFNNAGLKTSYHSYFYGCSTGISGVKEP